MLCAYVHAAIFMVYDSVKFYLKCYVLPKVSLRCVLCDVVFTHIANWESPFVGVIIKQVLHDEQSSQVVKYFCSKLKVYIYIYV